MKSISVMDNKAKPVGKITLDEVYFNGRVNKSLLHQYLLMYLANQRSHSASTKTRKQVRGSGRKPWRQKGTGRARVGSIRSPLWRGGGVVFGPKPRRVQYQLPKNIKNLALAHSLNSKVKDNQLAVVENFSLAKPKTSELVKLFKALEAQGKPLLVTEKHNSQIVRAAGNIPYAQVKTFNNLNAFDVLSHQKVIFSKPALKGLLKLRKQ